MVALVVAAAALVVVAAFAVAAFLLSVVVVAVAELIDFQQWSLSLLVILGDSPLLQALDLSV